MSSILISPTGLITFNPILVWLNHPVAEEDVEIKVCFQSYFSLIKSIFASASVFSCPLTTFNPILVWLNRCTSTDISC